MNLGRFAPAWFLALLLGGCGAFPTPFNRAPARPGRTSLATPLVTLPARTLGNLLIVEGKWDRNGPYRFLVDTGSSVTLVTPALAKRYAVVGAPPPDTPRVRVKSATGAFVELPATTLPRLQLGDARFDDVPALVYDCAALSAHLGLKIDGVLGFPLFRETLLTLDYPHSRVELRRLNNLAALPGTPLPLADANKTPLIHLALGDRTFLALIDSGSDAPLSLNPVGLDPKFAAGPRDGATVGTLAGDATERVGRLAETLTFADHALPKPVVSLTDELSSLGGAVLKHFSLTFDQQHERVTVFREAREPIVMPPRWSAGVSFAKTPAYWRIAGVVPASPAAAAGIEAGDLLTHIEGEPVAKWDLARYERLVATHTEIAFTFLRGTEEVAKKVGVFALVP
ncbi:MAG: hypothetical protein RLZZ15_426 [Verrucomicrobiota bacterium]|jgi:hypothetical protein